MVFGFVVGSDYYGMPSPRTRGRVNLVPELRCKELCNTREA